MDIRKFSMNYGALLGFSLVALSLLFWTMGIDEQKSTIPSLLSNILTVGILIYSIIQYRDNHNNAFITYGSAVKLGTTVAFFSSVIMAFYTFIHISYLNPDSISVILSTTEQSILETQPEISDEELDLALSMTEKLMQPHWMMIMGMLAGTFMGFIYSLIISIFLRTKQSSINSN